MKDIKEKIKYNQDGLEAKIEANNEKFEVLQENMWTSQEGMKTRIGPIVSWMGAWLEGTKDCRRATEASLEKKEPTPEEMANVAAHSEVPNEKAEGGNCRCTGGPIWGPASGRMVPPTTEETEPGKKLVASRRRILQGVKTTVIKDRRLRRDDGRARNATMA
jgi:hypothetical protein